jgi:hypothetical protein
VVPSLHHKVATSFLGLLLLDADREQSTSQYPLDQRQLQIWCAFANQGAES